MNWRAGPARAHFDSIGREFDAWRHRNRYYRQDRARYYHTVIL